MCLLIKVLRKKNQDTTTVNESTVLKTNIYIINYEDFYNSNTHEGDDAKYSHSHNIKGATATASILLHVDISGDFLHVDAGRGQEICQSH